MDQKFLFGGSIGYGDSYLEFTFRHFKVFRRHAIVHDAAGAVGAQIGEGPGYCWTRTKFMFAWSHDWTTHLPLRKTLFTFHFQICRLLKQ